jgi:epoxyqueuosine reductase QueG
VFFFAFNLSSTGEETRMTDNIRQLQDELENISLDMGVEKFGVADVTVAHDHMASMGGEFVRQFPRAVSLGSRLSDTIVDQLEHHDHDGLIRSYQWHVYQVANRMLDGAALRITKALQGAGYEAYPIHAPQYYNIEGLHGIISNKMAAHLSGLGWIGKSVLLVTPEFGHRARWATVMTDAPLVPGKPMERRCGDCNRCVEICPVSAFTGADFDCNESRDVRFNARACFDYYNHRRKTVMSKLAEGNNCGLCVFVCPYGRKGELNHG